ncbi:hypothetical protein ABZP36_008323 [Zizania latifolia]
MAGGAAGREVPAAERGGDGRHFDGEMEVMRCTTHFYRRHCISTYSIRDSYATWADLGDRVLSVLRMQIQKALSIIRTVAEIAAIVARPCKA